MNLYEYQRSRSLWSLHEIGNETLIKRSKTKMATMPIYGKNLKKIIFSGTKRLMTLKVGMQRLVLECYQFCSNDDPGMTLTQFTAMSKLVPYAFVWEKGKTVIFFRNYWIYDIKVGRCIHLNEALWEQKIKVIHGPWSFIDLGPNHSDSIF